MLKVVAMRQIVKIVAFVNYGEKLIGPVNWNETQKLAQEEQ